MPHHPWRASPEELRRLGHRAVDLIVEHMAGLRDQAVDQAASPEEARALVPSGLPDDPDDPEELLEHLGSKVLTRLAYPTHPRFFSFIPGPSSFLGVLGNLMANGFNVYAGTWMEGATGVHIELEVLDWIREALGFPEAGGGVLLSGGSTANLCAVAVARQRAGNPAAPRIYCTEDTHVSVTRSLHILGLPPEAGVSIPVDETRRMDVGALRARLSQDVGAGQDPVAIVATAGTTSTGAVDPLAELADLAAEHRVWLHVDGAHGAAAVFSPKLRPALAGIERADSVTLDPHKWLFQPYGAGALMVRDREALPAVFSTRAAYLDECGNDPERVNFFDMGPELSRPLRGLGLWLLGRTLGRKGLAEAVEHGADLADFAAHRLRAGPDWELVTEPSLGIVCFRAVPRDLPDEALDRVQLEAAARLREEGFAFVTTTKVRGRRVLRLAILHPATGPKDIDETLERLARHASEVAGGIDYCGGDEEAP